MKQKGLAPILLIILLAALALGGFLIYQKQTKPASSSQQITQPSPTKTDETVYTEASRSADWKTYTNTKNGYSLRYPTSFEVVRGQVPESALPTVDNISFSGMQKDGDPNAGVMLAISVNPTGVNGQAIQCTTPGDCLRKWMKVLNKSSNEVKTITRTIIGASVEGFEYQNINSLYTQTNQYFIYSRNGAVWLISVTVNNYPIQDVSETINQILSTFKFLP